MSSNLALERSVSLIDLRREPEALMSGAAAVGWDDERPWARVDVQRKLDAPSVIRGRTTSLQHQLDHHQQQARFRERELRRQRREAELLEKQRSLRSNQRRRAEERRATPLPPTPRAASTSGTAGKTQTGRVSGYEGKKGKKGKKGNEGSSGSDGERHTQALGICAAQLMLQPLQSVSAMGAQGGTRSAAVLRLEAKVEAASQQTLGAPKWWRALTSVPD